MEGWKDGPLPKLEVWREGLGPLLAATRPDVRAVVTDAPRLPEGAPEGCGASGRRSCGASRTFITHLAREQAHEP